MALETTPGDSNDGVKEGEADLDVEVVQGVHRAKHLLGIADLTAIHLAQVNYYRHRVHTPI